MYNLFYEYHFLAATKGLWKESLAYSLELKTQSFHPIHNVLIMKAYYPKVATITVGI